MAKNKENISSLPLPSEDDLNNISSLSEEDLISNDVPLPSEDDIINLKSSNISEKEPSQPEAFIRGLAQSGTIGFSDDAQAMGMVPAKEAQAAGMTQEEFMKSLPASPIEAIGEHITRLLTDSKYKKQYQESRKEAIQAEKAAQEAHPGTYLAGELTAAVVPGAGIIGGGSKVAREASLIKKAIEGAKAGSKIGAVAGLGTSEADLTKGEFGQAAIDVGVGAGLGGIVGGAVPVAVEGAKKVGSGIKTGAKKLFDFGTKEVEYGRDIARAYGLGKEGQGITTISQRQKRAEQVISAAKKMQDTIFKKLDENYDKKLKILKSKGDVVDFQKLYQETRDEIQNALKNFEITPEEQKDLLAQLNQHYYEKLPEKVKNVAKNKVTDVINPETGEIVSRTVQKIEKELPEDFTQVSAGKKAGERMKFKVGEEGEELTRLQTSNEETMDAVKEAVMRGEMSLEEAAKFVRSLQKGAFAQKIQSPGKAGILKRMAGKASDVIEEKAPETNPLNISSSSLYDMLDTIGVNPSKLKKGEVSEEFISFIKNLDDVFKNPNNLNLKNNVLKYMERSFGKKEAEKLLNESIQASHEYLLTQRAAKSTGLDWLRQVIGTVKDWGTKGANITGQGVRLVSRGAEKIFNFNPKQLEELSNNVDTTSRAGRKIKDFLSKAAQNQDQRSRQAILFSLIQDQEVRKYMEDDLGMKVEEVK